MPKLSYATSVPVGMPPENMFQAMDDEGQPCGSAALVEYTNYAILPECPLNYFLSIQATDTRAFDQLMGAALARARALRQKNPRMAARIYARCHPGDAARLQEFTAYGFLNDDAVVRMRRIFLDSERGMLPNPPVGCQIAEVALDRVADEGALLTRINAHSVIAQQPNWLKGLMQEPFFTALGMWQDNRLLGEMILTAYSSQGSIQAIYTLPDARRRGIASALVAEAGRILLNHGVRSLVADVW
ncbi:MAG: GNAT family N-acetyltransferase, partial [Oscillospiraceae bacterium]|nr:GNAT family N-acetyltransferase [Oscillospiraceae bacterium]